MSEEELFREVDEDVQRQRYAELWQRYGRYVVIAVFVVLGAVVAFVLWQNFQQSQRAARSDRFDQAAQLADQGRYGEAIGAFGELAGVSGGYGMLAKLRQAALLVEQGDIDGATAVYDAVAGDSGVDRIYRDLAVVLGALNNLDLGDPAALTARLEPLAGTDNPWNHTARELIGLLAVRSGDSERARALFQDLADDLTTPRGLRARAAEMLATLGQ